jgi:hypothetical protein
MATHGTILLTSKVETGKVLLQTSHDGHVRRAIKNLTGQEDPEPGYWDYKSLPGLPRWLAWQKRWRAENFADRLINPSPYHKPEPLTIQVLQEWEDCHATIELCLLELASWIVAADPLVYRVIPNHHFAKGYLPDYDRDPAGHLVVRILDYRAFEIRPHAEHGIDDVITVDLISEIHKLHLRWAQEMIAAKSANASLVCKM